MLHLAAIFLSIVFLFCSTPFVEIETLENDKNIIYRDTATVYDYDNGGIMTYDVTSEVIYYTSRSITKSHALAIQYPRYSYSPAVGACGAVAGGNIIGFYDRYDENLIPNHVSGTPYLNTYIYSIEDSAVHAVIDQLYYYMGTDHVGTTEQEFIDGLTKFCKEKGKGVSLSSCMKNGTFSYSTAQSYLESNQPIILFLSGYNVGTLFESENKDTMSYYYSNANHIMIGFGYRIYAYTTSSGSFNYELISVASGISGNSSGMFNINFQTTINDALAINIY